MTRAEAAVWVLLGLVVVAAWWFLGDRIAAEAEALGAQVAVQLALPLARPAALRARCRRCGTWQSVAGDELAAHGDCPARPIGNDRRVAYDCGCGPSLPAGLVAVAFGFAPVRGVRPSPCWRCGEMTRRAEYYEPGPLCRTCFKPVHRHDPFWHRGATS